MIGYPAALIKLLTLSAGLAAIAPCRAKAENWPRWRGSDGNAVSAERNLPRQWSTTHNVRWKVALPGEGTSSPIVWERSVFVTAATGRGARRITVCLDFQSGEERWRREIVDDDPEIASALTGHAAPTPATDGKHVVAFFGNAGLVCYDFDGRQLWHRPLGQFDSELGLASSPIIHDDQVILVCDHDGTRIRSFDSFLASFDLRTGKTRWKTDRADLLRSWSTPIVVPHGDSRRELIVSAQDELRGYDPVTGRQLWTVGGMTGWVTPSPVFHGGLIFAVSGRNGPLLAVRPGGRQDAAKTHVAWKHEHGGPYVCSPLVYDGRLYVHDEAGVLTCYSAASGQDLYRQRLQGKFMGSGVAGDGKLYLTNDEGTTYVVRCGDRFSLEGENRLAEESIASPAISGGAVLLRTERHLYCIAAPPSR